MKKREVFGNIISQRREGAEEDGKIVLSSFCGVTSELSNKASFFASSRLCERLFFALVLTILFASCASAPKVPFSIEEEGAEIALLPPGGLVYFWADAIRGRPILDVLSFDGRSAKDMAQILDSVKSAAGVVFPSNEEPESGARRFYLAATGDFPRGTANFSFTFSRAWKKRKSSTGNSYWYSQNDNIALSMGSNLVLVSDKDPFLAEAPVAGEGAPRPPAGFMDFRKVLAFAGWISDPSEPVNKFIENLGLPIQLPAEDFFFGAVRSSTNLSSSNVSSTDTRPWELVFKIRTASDREAGALLTLFSLARLFIQRGASQGSGSPQAGSSISPQEAAALLFANAPEQDGSFLTLRTGTLDENRIALLFYMFSIYSK